MGLLDRLFEPEKQPIENVKGGTRENLEAQPNYDDEEEKDVNITGNAAEEIFKNAMASLEGRQTTIYTLKDLVATLPPGVKKEAILGVLEVTKVSAEEIQKDGQDRLSLLESAEAKLQKNVNGDIQKLEAEIKEAENLIEENRKKKAVAEELLRNFRLLKSKTSDEIKSILSTIE